MDIITANGNSHVKEISKLNKDAKLRKTQGVFVVEGIRMFQEIPEGQMEKACFSESFVNKNPEVFEACKRRTDLEVYVLKDSVFNSVSQTKTPQGCLGVVKCPKYCFEDVVPKDKGAYLVLENIQDPGNLGTIFRSAEAAGIKGILMNEGCCDVYNPKVVRSTMGAIFRVPHFKSDNLPETIDEMKKRDVFICGAHLKGSDLYDTKLPERVAFLIGNEGNGLTDEVSKKADLLVRIPMEGQVESLNAAISATLLSYEAMRQSRSE